MRMTLDTKSIRKQLSSIEEQQARVGILNKGLRYPDQPLVRVSDVLGYLESKRGVLSKAPYKASQSEIDDLAQAFVDMATDPSPSAKIDVEALSKDLVKDPIIEREYGHNHPNVVKKKGFDHYGIDTRWLIRNITARWERR